MRNLRHIFLEALTNSCQIKQGDHLVIAVSSGSDSMAMLHLLAGVQQRLRLSLTAAWVDHGLRPAETPQEKRVVSEAAKKLNIAFIPHQVDVASCAREQHLSLEHAARDLRYAALRQTAHTAGATYIAVAHTADDQAEEILLRLLRGSGGKGISGMRMRGKDIIRPLLGVGKEDLLQWLAEEDIAYCVDSSNNDMKFLRNRVRHQLLPFMEEHFDGGIKKSLRKTAASLAEDEQLLEELTTAAIKENIVEITGSTGSDSEASPKMLLQRLSFSALHPALRRRVVEQLLWRMGCKAKYSHILLIVEAAATGKNNSELHLTRGLRIGIFRDRLEFSYPAGQKAWRGRLLNSDQ